MSKNQQIATETAALNAGCRVSAFESRSPARGVGLHSRRMNIKRYNNDYRLFFWIAVALFTATFLLPSLHKDSPSETRFGELLNQWNHRDGDASLKQLVGRIIEEFSLWIILSAVLAWFMQITVVLMRGLIHERRTQKASNSLCSPDSRAPLA